MSLTNSKTIYRCDTKHRIKWVGWGEDEGEGRESGKLERELSGIHIKNYFADVDINHLCLVFS
jgi:hypothetical protein